MIAVDEQHVNETSAECPFDVVTCFNGVGVPDEEMDALLIERESLKERPSPSYVAAAETKIILRREVDRNENRVGRRDAREQEERPPSRRSHLDNTSGLETLDKEEEIP